MNNLLNFESVDKLVDNAFIPKREGVGYNFLDDILPMVKSFYNQRKGQLENIATETEPARIPVSNLKQNGQSAMQRAGSGPMFELIKKYFPQEEWERAYNVMLGESGGRPEAIGDNYPIKGQTIPSYGLFQIRGLQGRPDKSKLLDPEFNVKYAADMWKSQGWGPWSYARKLGYVE